MKLAVSAWSVQKKLFSKEMTLFGFADLCKANGIMAIELLDCFFENDYHVATIKEYIEKQGMTIPIYSIGNDFVNIDPKIRAEQVQSIKDGVDRAVFLGAKVLRVFSGSAKDDLGFDEGMKYILDSFAQTVEYAEQKGITMALENHGRFAGKSEQVKAIIEQTGSPALCANADIGNFLLVCEDSLDAVKNLGQYIRLVHFKDFKRITSEQKSVYEGHVYQDDDGTDYIGCVLGEGNVPIKGVVSHLKSIGYTGYLSIEFEGNGDQSIGAAASMKYAKSVTAGM